MAEAQLWPSITKERNTLEPSLNPTAPVILAISVGAQQRTTILPCTLNSSKSTMERKTSVSTIQLQEGSTQQPAMTTQGAIFEQRNVKPPDEPPAKPIPPKPPPLRVEKTYTHVYPQELLQEKPIRSPQRIILRKMRQQVLAPTQVEGNTTGDSSNAHPPEETPTPRSRPQLPNYASRNQNQSNPAPTRRSPTPNPNRTIPSTDRLKGLPVITKNHRPP